ncbi:MAG: hypothetical protein KatS3mg102_2697 [Planctomycetota bacterium]|nr:MAG: hypothetical protein KatS3mg102_2697 [Planctomycetota bacterium]
MPAPRSRTARSRRPRARAAAARAPARARSARPMPAGRGTAARARAGRARTSRAARGRGLDLGAEAAQQLGQARHRGLEFARRHGAGAQLRQQRQRLGVAHAGPDPAAPRARVHLEQPRLGAGPPPAPRAAPGATPGAGARSSCSASAGTCTHATRARAMLRSSRPLASLPAGTRAARPHPQRRPAGARHTSTPAPAPRALPVAQRAQLARPAAGAERRRRRACSRRAHQRAERGGVRGPVSSGRAAPRGAGARARPAGSARRAAGGRCRNR